MFEVNDFWVFEAASRSSLIASINFHSLVFYEIFYLEEVDMVSEVRLNFLTSSSSLFILDWRVWSNSSPSLNFGGLFIFKL